MVTFPSASTEIGPVVIGVTFVVVTASPFKVSFPASSATGVVPEANGADVFLMYRLSQ
jgi:hypothetical protein